MLVEHGLHRVDLVHEAAITGGPLQAVLAEHAQHLDGVMAAGMPKVAIQPHEEIDGGGCQVHQRFRAMSIKGAIESGRLGTT